MAGLDSTGLTSKDLDDVLEDLRSRAVTEFGADVKTDETSALGHLLRAQAPSIVELWELAQLIYSAMSPDTAVGAQLDAICAFVGVTREPATFTTGTVTLGGAVGVVIPAGKLVRDATTGEAFALTSTVTIGAGGTVDASVQSEEAGAVEALAGDVVEIVTPIPGWTSVTNAADFTAGENAESDAELRLRRARSLQIVGAGPDAAIRARLEQIDGVTAARVISNRTLAVDANGIPAKAFRAVVWPDTLSMAIQTTIAETIWATMPAGIEPDGAESFTVTDAFGYSQLVNFSFASGVPVYVRVELETDANFPADGLAQAKAAIVAYLDGLSVGDDVRTLKVLCAVSSIAGVTGATVLLDTIDPPVGTTDIDIAIDEIAVVTDAGATPDVGDVRVSLA